MITGFRHVGIVVPDLEAALDFYGRVLGLQVIRHMEEGGEFLQTLLGMPDVKATTVKMGLAGNSSETPSNPVIELLFFHQPIARQVQRRLDDRGPTHLALTVDDIDDLHDRLQKEDFNFISAPVLSEDGAVKLAFGQTADGTFLELVEEFGS